MKSNIYNKVVVRLIMGLLPFYLSAFLPSEAGARKHKQLVILHTNDTHSTILPVNSNIDNKDLAGRGGFLRRVNVVKEQRELHPELLLIDSGDFSQGSGYYTLFKGEVEIGLMNMMATTPPPSATTSLTSDSTIWRSSSGRPISPSSAPTTTARARCSKTS